MTHALTCISLFLTLLFVAEAVSALPNDCDAGDLFQKHYPHAKKMLKEQKCVQIDVTASYDSAGAELVLRWDLGDGNQAQGFRVNHCYDNFGSYKAILSIFTKDGEMVSPNEMRLDVAIKEEATLVMTVPDTVLMDSLFMPVWTVSDLQSYKIEQTLFDFGDGVYSCGNSVGHSYSHPGFYNLRMLMILGAVDGEFYLAFEKKIFVKGYNVQGQLIAAYFNHWRNSVQVPYLNDPIRMSIVNAVDHQIMESKEIALDSHYCQFLPEGIEVWLFIWQGNSLLQPILISAIGDSSESFDLIHDALKKGLKAPPIVLDPVYFTLNEVNPNQRNKRILNKNIQVLQSLPGVAINIGSHSHSGGMRGIVGKFTDSRSEYIKGEIQKQLRNNISIFIDSPQNTESLINTCFDDPDCGRENIKLNGRSDFRIIAIGKI
jgi:hypothetical protein